MKTYVSLKPLIPWRQAKGPLDWDLLYGRKAPLEVEIGFGNGERLVRQAQRKPEFNYLGIDISWPSVRRALRKVGVLGLKNVLIVQAGAEPALKRLFEPESITKITALFPRPWPARQHEKYRLFSTSCLEVVNNRLASKGEVEIVTDFKPYADWVEKQVPGKRFDLACQVIPAGQQTKYERKWLNEGCMDFYRLFLSKTGHAPSPVWEDFDLKLHLLDDFDPDGFPLGEYNGKFFVSFKEMFFDPAKQKALLRTISVEDDLRQSYWLEFSRKDGKWRLRLTPGCGVLPVASVQWSLDLARDLALGSPAADKNS